MNTGFGYIKMNIVTRFISFILVFLPLLVHSGDTESSSGPGSSACIYFGDIDTLCNIATVDVDQIPEECSSIFFNDAVADNFKVSLHLDSQIENLNALLACKKKVFLQYSQLEYPLGWPNALQCNVEDGGQKARCEMDSLKAFLEQYSGIAGLVITNIDPGIFPANYSCPTENFKVYLDVMKETFKNLTIGFCVDAQMLIDFNFNPTGQWLDFSCLDASLDFYVINMYTIRTCTPDLIQSGGYPTTGNYTYTMEKAMEYVANAKIPKEKCLLQYTIGATSPDVDANPCDFSNTMLCTDPSKFCNVCTENLDSFFEKGKFAATNAMGFIVDTIDADDPGSACCCPMGPFPAFRALLDGLNGADQPQCCPKYDIWST